MIIYIGTIKNLLTGGRALVLAKLRLWGVFIKLLVYIPVQGNRVITTPNPYYILYPFLVVKNIGQ